MDKRGISGSSIGMVVVGLLIVLVVVWLFMGIFGIDLPDRQDEEQNADSGSAEESAGEEVAEETQENDTSEEQPIDRVYFDLKATKLNATSNGCEDANSTCDITIVATLKNTGNVRIPQKFRAHLFDTTDLSNLTILESYTISGIEVDEEQTFTYEYGNLEPGTYYFQFRVDPVGNVVEINEDDNQLAAYARAF